MTINGNPVDGRTRQARELQMVADEAAAMNQAAERRKVELRSKDLEERMRREIKAIQTEVTDLRADFAKLQERFLALETSMAEARTEPMPEPPSVQGMIYAQDLSESMSKSPNAKRRG